MGGTRGRVRCLPPLTNGCESASGPRRCPPAAASAREGQMPGSNGLGGSEWGGLRPGGGHRAGARARGGIRAGAGGVVGGFPAQGVPVQEEGSEP